MMSLIRGATRWVHLDVYIIRDDETGQRFAEALIERARAGVPVRVSTDWLGSFGTSRRFWRALEQAGASVRIFNRPHLLDLPSLLSRNHRKLLVVDGRSAVLGGLCIGDEWAGDPDKKLLPWRDTAIRIDGPAAAVIDHAFARTWRQMGPSLPLEEQTGAVEPMGNASIRVLAGEPVRERAYRVSELLLASAAERVWITDAYLVAPRRLFRYLVDAATEGVDVRLLVPGSSDLVLVRNLTRFGYRELIRAGVRIFEWDGPMLHAKTVVADGRWVRIGSSNLNHSSLLANWELDVLVDDPLVAAGMEARFRRDLEQAAEVSTRPLRAPARVRRILPMALDIPPGPVTAGYPRRGLRERRGRSVLAVRTLVAGARLAIFGPLAAILALIALLFFVIPGVMAVMVGALCGWLAMIALAEALRRRRELRS
jgi:cardiolipin synthase A/B